MDRRLAPRTGHRLLRIAQVGVGLWWHAWRWCLKSEWERMFGIPLETNPFQDQWQTYCRRNWFSRIFIKPKNCFSVHALATLSPWDSRRDVARPRPALVVSHHVLACVRCVISRFMYSLRTHPLAIDTIMLKTWRRLMDRVARKFFGGHAEG